MRRFLLFLLLLVGIHSTVSAQWRAGGYGGLSWCERSIQSGYDYVRLRFADTGGMAGLMGQYNFKDWLGVRTDVNVQWRNFHERYSIVGERYSYRNMYVNVPVMANFSFGGKKLRGYVNLGGYAGIWACRNVDSRQWNNGSDASDRHSEVSQSGFSAADKRIDAGAAGGVGLSYQFFSNWIANAECLLYYGLLNNHDTGSSRYSQPSYDTVPCVTLGVAWLF